MCLRSRLHLGEVGYEDQQESFENVVISHPHVSPLASLQWGPENSLSKFPALLTLLSNSHNLRSTALEGLAHR